MRFGTRAFYGRALAVALPVMAQLFIQNLVSLIDNFMVSNLGDIKMSGVNIAGQINFLFIVLLFNVVCPGAGIFMSQFKGANDSEGMKQVFRLKLVLCLCSAAAWTVLCLTGGAPLLGLMVKGNAASSKIVASAVSYQKTLAWAWLPVALSAAISSSLRETGRVKAPLVISVAAAIVNTMGNYALIYGHFGAPRLEVVGAAIATVAARAVETAAFLVYMAVTKPEFITHIKDVLCINARLVTGVLSKAAGVAVSELSWAVTETISIAVFNSRGGAEVVSGMAAGFTIANLFFVSFAGIFTATGVLLGTTLGRGDMDEARNIKSSIVNGCIVFGLIFGLLGASSSLLIPVVFPGLSLAARTVSRGLVLIAAAYMPLWCVLNAQVAVSRAGGDTAMGAIMDMSANILLLLMIFPLAAFTRLGPIAIYTIIKLTDVYKMVFAALWLRRGLWLHNIAKENDLGRD